MNRLILHHEYLYGSTFDTSGTGNHGVPQLVNVSGPPPQSALRFAAADSRITVRPSESLAHPFAVAAMVRFTLSEAAPGRRYNLIEGHLSFALFVAPSGALAGTILDADARWTGASTGPGFVTPGVPHEAWLIHDGISQLELQLDGRPVARAWNVAGPVRGVGPLGIAIGNWPDAGAYAFAGDVDEVRVFVYDPARDVASLLDPCCFDGRLLDEIARDLAKRGAFANAREAQDEMLAFLARLARRARGNDPARTRQVVALGQAAFAALRRRDARELKRVRDASLALVRAGTGSEPTVGEGAGAPADAPADAERQLASVSSRVGLDESVQSRLLRALCLRLVDAAGPRPSNRQSPK